jgi:hypothetical protein
VAATLFSSLAGARGGRSPDLEDADRKTWLTDLVIALSAFPSLPDGAKQYARPELRKRLPEVDQLEAQPNIHQAFSKISRIFCKSERVTSILRIASSY